MGKVEFIIDPQNKTIKPVLPEIEMQKPIIDTGEIDFMPADARGDLKEIISVCEEDALGEAQKAPELKQIAQENIEKTIEALLCPILEAESYKIIWDE